MRASPRDAESQSFAKASNGARQAQHDGGPLELRGAGTRSVEAWFLGPKGENADVFERLVVEAIRDHVFWRRNYYPGDPSHITEDIKRSADYVQAMGALQEGYQGLLAFLKKSVPFFSMRYQGHMNWDLTMPSLLGYFAAMLYNPNNVAFEGSTATTILELLAADDICQMLGYRIPSDGAGSIRPWGHITCDGTVANIEAVWAARNLKFYPVTFKEALLAEPGLAPARGIRVRLPSGGEARLAEMDTWSLLNLRGDDALGLPGRVTTEFGIEPATVSAALEKYSLQTIGIQEFSRRFLSSVPEPAVFMVPGTKHYSFPKAAAVLGIGSGNMWDIAVDDRARLSLEDLKRRLDRCLAERRAVYSVVAVMGTTEESAVDPLAGVLALREEFRARGLDFCVHADAAWGGYHASLVREDFDLPDPGARLLAEPGPPIITPLSKYVAAQYQALSGADSITVDPHKSGYVPYPAGALCYRNSATRNLVTFSAPVVFHGDAEPTVGIYGIEGSKPGAAAAAVYLSHRVIRPTKEGYGKIIGQALFSCKRLYVRLLCMTTPGDSFVAVPLAPLPEGLPGKNEEERLDFLRTRIDRRTNDEIAADAEAAGWLPELGPDQNILAYAFNFVHDGRRNTSLSRLNELNKAMYDRLSIDPGHDIYGYSLIVSTTDLHVDTYGQRFFDEYTRRLGATTVDAEYVTVLRSVVMDPWVTETRGQSFIDVLETEFRKAANAAVRAIERGAAPPAAFIRGY